MTRLWDRLVLRLLVTRAACIAERVDHLCGRIDFLHLHLVN
jgi:hypothetical protein